MNIIGIDPGKSGGIVLLGPPNITAEPMPDTVGDLVDMIRSLAVSQPVTAFVEQVHAMPKQGVVSCFTFGRGLGNLEAALQAFSVPLRWVRPQEWQKAMGCLTKGDKNVSKARAQELFPTLKITHAIADALLIAEYGRRVSK